MSTKQKPTSNGGRERRMQVSPVTVKSTRGTSGTVSKKIRGLAVVFAPSRSKDLGSFYEEIDNRAFDKALASPDLNCIGVWQHNPDLGILGRTTSGTLRLSKTSKGIEYEIDPPNTTLANDLITSMERGDVVASSFCFICTKDSWRQDAQGNYIRTVLEATIHDVSPVSDPAYADATSGYRAAFRNAPAALKSSKTVRELIDTDAYDDDDNIGDIKDQLDDDDERCACRCLRSGCNGLNDEDQDADDNSDDSELNALRARLQAAIKRTKR